MEVNPIYDYPMSAFAPKTRVELHPATDLWMMGARYGTVVTPGRTRVTVALDTGRRVTVPRTHIKPIEDD